MSGASLLQLIRDRVHHPATARELAQILRIPREERAAFKRQLKALVTSGELLQVRGNRFGVPDKMDLVVGKLTTNPGGFGFVVPEHPFDSRSALAQGASVERKDIYIAGTNLLEAMHGDRVVARVERQTPKGLEGRIIRILGRGNETIVGRFESDDGGLGY